MYFYKLQTFAPEHFSEEEIRCFKKKHSFRGMPGYLLHMLLAAEKEMQNIAYDRDLALIYVSHFGSGDQTPKMIYSILDYPPEQISAGSFVYSLYNTPVSYLTKLLQCHGPALSLAGDKQILRTALITAQSYLENHYCQEILFILADEKCEFTDLIREKFAIRLFIPLKMFVLSATAPDGDDAPDLDADAIYDRLLGKTDDGPQKN